MYKITNIESLGEEYTVTYKNGDVINTIQILNHADILNAALGEYNDSFIDIADYMTRSIEKLEGYADVDPLRVLWYTSHTDETQLSDMIESAIKHGYDKIIVEYIGEEDDKSRPTK